MRQLKPFWRGVVGGILLAYGAMAFIAYVLWLAWWIGRAK